MLLSSEKIKPFICHETSDIRMRAVQYFSDSWSQDEDLIPLVFQACDQYKN